MLFGRRRIAAVVSAVLVSTALVGGPVVAVDPTDCPTPVTDPALCPTPAPAPPSSPPKPVKPTKPASPAKPAPPAPTKRPKPAKPDKKPLTPEEAEAKRKREAESAFTAAAAAAAVAAAQQAFAEVEPKYEAARKKLRQAEERQKRLAGEIAEARLLLSRTVRQAYVEGADPQVLASTVLLTATSPEGFADSSVLLGQVGAAQNSKLESSLRLINEVEEGVRAARAEFQELKPQYDLIRINLGAARVAAGLDAPETDLTKIYNSYPVPDCSFERTDKTTVSCQDAMRWAIAQVQMPTENWFYLCLKFVTVAYGAPQTPPRAIDMWNSMPAESKRSPNTVAPPGALMFWAPNHVALSLGNNMMVSTDTLGNGRVWIVSMEQIQAVWNFPYLGWAEPNWANA